ncbi:NACHT domain-containing protein [Streptomyces sp. NPDC020192]|uniref:NACHT domain-containing protein n=1 Tax=Streptomyces sp. NPDC020192 TaxID=3365066 RepID=UPI00379A65B6
MLAAACLALAAWAVFSLASSHKTDVSTVVGLAAGLLAVAGAAGRLLKPPDVDLTQAAGNLAVAVQAGELAQRTQLLGGDNEPIDVAFMLRAAPSRVAAGAAGTGTLREITDYYRRLQPQRLIITGAAGAGKTVLAVELMLGLLEQRKSDEPVPVRLPLAGWDTTQPLDDWLTHELADIYQLSTATARRLVDQRRVLPVLDGLDEMDPQGSPAGSSRAADALAALNRYQAGRQKAALVLTCRTTTYDTLAASTRLLDAARVEVEPVTADQAQAFVTARVLDPQPWQPVIDHAQGSPHGAVAQVLSTPWLLTLAVTVYEAEGDPTELLRFTDLETLRDHLLDCFVPAATELHARAGNRAHHPEQVERWLRILARYLNDNIRAPRTVGGQLLPGTDLVLHRLWPLAGTRALMVEAAINGTAGILVVTWMVHSTFMATSAVLALLAISWIAVAITTAWPAPKGVDPGRLRTPAGRRAAMGPLAVGLVVGLALSLAVALTLATDPTLPFASALLTVTLPQFLPIGLIAGLAFGLRLNLETAAPGGRKPGPTDLVRADLRAGLSVGFLAGIAGALAVDIAEIAAGHFEATVHYWIQSLVPEALLDGGILAVLFGLIWAGAWRRYLATLLCTRGRLPWRLGRFLAWAYDAGLLRIAGVAYQFRHRELQDHLAERQRADGSNSPE